MKTTAWDQFKNLINNKKIGDTVSRQELLFICSCSETTVDYMRNLSEKTNFLGKHKNVAGKVISGVFDVKEHFPKNLTISSLRTVYDYEVMCNYQTESLYLKLSEEDKQFFDDKVKQAEENGLKYEVLRTFWESNPTVENALSQLCLALNEWDC